jgi:hypothetical protein
MKPDFKKILKKHQSHTTILDEKSIISALEETYSMGKKNSEGEFNQLKEAFQSLLYEHAHSCNNKKAAVLLIEDWEKKAGIY